MGGRGSGRISRKPAKPDVNQVRSDLLSTYQRLGGPNFLYSYSKAHPDDFLKHLLKLIPVPREEQIAPSYVPDPLNMLEAARRIAFVLASANAHQPQAIEMAEVVPAPEQDPVPLPPLDEAPVMAEPPAFNLDPEGIAETRTENIASYRGTPSEQGEPYRYSNKQTKKASGQKQAHDNFMAVRRRALL